MKFPHVTVADWRAQVEKELAGVPFDKALVRTSAEGLKIEPLYTELAVTPAPAPAARDPFALCMPYDGDEAGLAEDLAGGAEAIWLRNGDVARVFAHADVRRVLLVVDAASAAEATLDALVRAARRHELAPESLRFVLGVDPFGDVTRGAADASALPAALAALGRHGVTVERDHPRAHGVLVSTLPSHLAGADAADELAAALSTGAAYLAALLDAGLTPAAAARQIAVRIAVGRDTFGELCKLRALRVCWGKLCAAVGAPASPLVHAVASARTATARDPWVNMLRGTTEAFAAILGGADLVTPLAYDEAVGPPSPLSRRVARNTALVLREESQLGRVIDPAGGSYYLETLTDALARQAWHRFRAIEADGGLLALLADGRWRARLDAAWQARRDAVAKRKEPIVGVSEFANLDEKKLPRAHTSTATHRDAEELEALRDRADALAAAGRLPTVALVTLGPATEHRARLGYASAFFAIGGLRSQASTATEGAAPIACLCGSDERYATEAADAARALKAAGAARVLLAGRPGALEATLRDAGVDGFLYVGCDIAATLGEILGASA